MRNTKAYAYKGNILFTPKPKELSIYPDSYILVEDGIIKGVYSKLPEEYKGIQIEDYSDNIIMPGFADLHVHAPQFEQIGIGLDYELIDWLNKYTFKTESKFENEEYAQEMYKHFVNKLAENGTLNSSIFATIHTKSTEILCELLKAKGLSAYVGKVNMDANSPSYLIEDTDKSLYETEKFICKYLNDVLVKPIITPRFAPTSTKKLLQGLGQLSQKYKVNIQSHLNENRNEINWVKELFQDSKSYSDVYNDYGLFGQMPTLMAHGIYLTEEEINLIKEKNVFLVHCPDSNLNVASGVMKLRELLDIGIKIGLGSDVGGGHSLSMKDAIVRAVQMSKILKVLEGSEAVTLTEAFYMATKGGGSFFGKTGSFEEGYFFDALVIKPEEYLMKNYSVQEQWQRFMYAGDQRNIIARFVRGNYICCN